MSTPTANEDWMIDAGDAVIEKKAPSGIGSLSALDRLIYCLWVADYGMRNAGDLAAAYDAYPEFQTDAARLAQDLSLQATYRAFSLPTAELQAHYFERFDEICNELRRG